MEAPKVVIVGSSYSGAAVFNYLVNSLEKCRQPFDILFIADKNYYFFKPLLLQFLCNNCSLTDICHEFRSIKYLRPPITYLNSTVLNIDLKHKMIKTIMGQTSFDYLVLAPENDINETNSLFKNNCFQVNSISEAVKLKNHIVRNLEVAASPKDHNKQKALLTISVIGANNYGIELVCSVSDLVNELMKNQYPELNKSHLKVYLIEESNTIGTYSEPLCANYLFYNLNKKGIKVLTNSKITNIDINKIEINNDKEIISGTVICSTTNNSSSLIKNLLVKKDEKFKAHVDLYLKAQGMDDVFVIGESSKCIDLSERLANNICFYNEQAKACALNIISTINNNPLKAFKPNEEIDFISLGSKNSLAKIKRFYFGGLVAWFINRLMYVFCFLSPSKKIKALAGLFANLTGFNDYVSFNELSLEEEKQLVTAGKIN